MILKSTDSEWNDGVEDEVSMQKEFGGVREEGGWIQGIGVRNGTLVPITNPEMGNHNTIGGQSLRAINTGYKLEPLF